MASILVVGCLSRDKIHLESSGVRRSYSTTGGAGLFTALAAARQGAEVTLYAPMPSPLPEDLKEIASMLHWIGPEAEPDNLPSLEIIHHGEGRATLLGAGWGPEASLTPEDLQARLKDNNQFEIVHIAALSSAARQLQFLRMLREHIPKISAGTYARAIQSDPASVKALLTATDYFFMNSNEANLLFEKQKIDVSVNQIVFVTDGKDGATIFSARGSQHVDASPAEELDPTGAGDTFCGAALAVLGAGEAPQQAAIIGAQLAARVIEHAGSGYYFA